MDYGMIGSVVGGVVGTQILVRIVWKYLEGRKNNPGNHFEVLFEKLSSLESRLIDKLNALHDDIRGLK